MEFTDRMKQVFDRGLESSRELFSKARDKAQDLGEKGVLKFEIMQLESQAEKLMAKLGTRCYEALTQEGAESVSINTAGVHDLISEIDQVEKRIREKEVRLAQQKGSPDSDQASEPKS